MPKTNPKKLDAPTQALHELLLALRRLDGIDRWLLAAFVDWQRTDWSGIANFWEKDADVLDSVRFIVQRAAKLRAEAIEQAAIDTLAAAVTS